MSHVNRVVLAGLFSWLLPLIAEAASPPNDSFANRIVLSGDSITFAGTLAGATREPGGSEVTGYPIYPNFSPSQSVWWEWTPTNSKVITIQITDSSPRSNQIDGLVVYANPGPGFPTNLIYGPVLAGVALDPANPWPCFSFYGTNGTTHYVMLVGTSGGTLTISLLATNNPIMIEQPKSQLTPTNGSALFSVVATGIRPLSYQWWFGGILLTNQTNAMLALDRVDMNNAGPYYAVVSNVTGVTTSTVATLSVTESAVRPWLTGDRFSLSNLFLTLHGEAGRHYRIETSADIKL